MRRPQDRVGQRQLVYELRHAIDRCRRRSWDPAARDNLDRLLADNPRSSRAGHVLYNLGPTRREWLASYLVPLARSIANKEDQG